MRVNAVAGLHRLQRHGHHAPVEGPRSEMAQTVPLGRFGTEAEVAAAIVHLFSPAAAFIEREPLRVDGARPKRPAWAIP